ncbi:hypothetical protein FisN_2Lh289 [Fistulifera solaris]|uniref:Uncharacterized protein n=1 Tax=Fistulifera solaris TaxID=1519565 RepID=A0A1Z5KFM4_FISSO|nr:hypothetical protein FisN_2Lh289 [Fistulifera solaris]|eukprot:GAX25006.1 hypothetical protein FisN_2Lh289 [Fistulifera solaris]
MQTHLDHGRSNHSFASSNVTITNENDQQLMVSFVQPSASYQIDTTDLWESSETLPEWMKDYFRWHKEARQSLFHNDNNHRLMIVSCLPKYIKCGGLADRLMTLPFLVRVAALSERVLLFQWGRPAPLEEFLLPPVGGVDWRLPPDWNGSGGERVTVQDEILTFASNHSIPSFRVKFQAHDHGQVYYDYTLLPDEPTFSQVFAECWRVFFTPAPPIAKRIQTYMNNNGLEVGKYPSTHLRALYNVEERDPRFLEQLTRHAVNCSLQFVEAEYPYLFFASDASYAQQVAGEYGTHRGYHVISPQHEQNPLHLDKAIQWRSRSPSEYYDAFVDLYVLSLGKCVSYGMGGYGKLASYMSQNASCALQHMTAISLSECRLTTTYTRARNTSSHVLTNDRIFPPPMRGLTSEEDGALLLLRAEVVHPKPQAIASTRIWNDSTQIPQWMKDYFNWHAEQRQRLSPENWNETRYIIMTCMESDEKCGGTSDRLRLLPAMVRVAANTNRLLLLYWERPAFLTEFLVPPVGGVNWVVPDWFHDILKANADRIHTLDRLVAYSQSNRTVIMSRIQISDHGSKYYKEQALQSGESEDALRQHYRDCWRSFFTPAPKVAKQIESEMKGFELIPYEYSSVHLRAQYGLEEHGRDPAKVYNWTVNSLNCISHLRPGGPFFFASDSAYAREVAVEYGKSRNTPVATRLHDKDPLHMDLKPSQPTSPSDYYAVFVDLYIISMGECLAYNMGGFGKWGLLLSGRNLTCTVRHWTAGVPKAAANKNGCTWQDGPTERQQLNRTLELPLFLPPMNIYKQS